MIDDLTPQQVAERLRGDDPPWLVDVREDWERAIAHVPGSVHIPMGQLPDRLAELPHDRPIALLCHHGSRSLQVARWLQQQGWTALVNVDGGIHAWAATVDREIPQYT